MPNFGKQNLGNPPSKLRPLTPLLRIPSEGSKQSQTPSLQCAGPNQTQNMKQQFKMASARPALPQTVSAVPKI
jgi:hypothetical protein